MTTITEAVFDRPAEPITARPRLDGAGFHGPAGEYALAADPYTEADPVGVLVSVLAGAAAAIGSGPHIMAGNDRHTVAVWPVLVGDTSKGGKGTAWSAANAALAYVDSSFFTDSRDARVLGGFGSGEALIDAIRDADDKERAAADKRLLVLEREYARMLKVASRDQSILSAVVREGWDGKRLQTRNRAHGSVVATGYHLVVCGHITTEELRSVLSQTDAFNGWANRFLWVHVHRSKRLPQGGNVPDGIARRHAETIRQNIAAGRPAGRMERTDEAEKTWAEVYNALGDDEPLGLLGAVVARAEPMVLRLSLLYAVLDGSRVVDVPHIDAAYALWRYCRTTAERIWGKAIGDPAADKLLDALRKARRLTGDEQHGALGRHAKGEELTRARRLLVTNGLAVEETESTGGRPAQVLVLCEKSERSEESHLLSHNSLYSHSQNGNGS